MPVAEAHAPYATKLVSALRKGFVRAEADLSHETLNKRIRNAATLKIPNVLVVGEREAADEAVTLRRYGVQEQSTMPFAELRARLERAIATRAPTLD